MTNSVQPSSEIFRDITKGVSTGAKIMLAQTPFVTSLNRVSVVSCYLNIPMLEAARQIFQGTVDSANYPSTRHFLKGVSGHLTKETARVGFKASGIVLKPRLDHYFQNSSSAKFKSDLVFAGSLSIAEMFINPADTVRTMWQANEKISHVRQGRLFSHLYKGATANGLRQFGTWLGFSISERICSDAIEKTTSIDSHSMSGIALKAFPQSFQLTTPIWLFERLKNELQYHPKLDDKGKKTSRYVRAFMHIISNQGWPGFLRGFMPKVWSNAILVVGADYLLEQGRKAQKQS